MRYVVTGVAGFLGSHLAEALVEAGHTVIGVDAFTGWYPRHVKEDNIAGLSGQPGFTLVEADLAETPLEPIVRGADGVLHLAAQPGLSNDPVVQQRYERDNVAATRSLVEAIVATGAGRLVHASTSSVYGTLAVGDERLPLGPVSTYGRTKLEAERIVLGRVGDGLDAVVLRYFSMFGPRQRPDMAYHRFIEALLDGRTIDIHGDGEQSRSNTYVADATAATIAALERGRSGEVYNVGGGETITVNEAVATLADLLGVEPSMRHVPAREGDQRHTAADVGKAERELGWRPTVGARDGLARQVAWQRGRRTAVGSVRS